MNIGNKIKKLRIENDLTQEELARKLYVTRNAISKWETNKGVPNIISLVELSKLFNISLDDMLSDEEITKITLANKEHIARTKNLLSSLVLFVVYVLVGILIPHYSFLADPTSGIAVFLILLPFSYVILGVITVIFRIHWPYVMISSALALIPIYIYFDSLPSVSISFWGVVYLALFYASYFLLFAVLKLSIFKNNPKWFKRLFLIISCALSVIYIVHTFIAAIAAYNCLTCSAPWELAIIANTLCYIIPLVVSYTLLIVFTIKSRKE